MPFMPSHYLSSSFFGIDHLGPSLKPTQVGEHAGVLAGLYHRTVNRQIGTLAANRSCDIVRAAAQHCHQIDAVIRTTQSFEQQA